LGSQLSALDELSMGSGRQEYWARGARSHFSDGRA